MQALISSWALSLRAANRSEHTQSQYRASVEQFARYLAEHGLSTDLRAVRREHVETYLADLGSRWKAST
ncbi:MAG TPA: site-specific integrase, partial [Acidimicrobiales bacterium]